MKVVQAMNRAQKPVVLFVHGFGSDWRCWRPLLKLLRKDKRITSRYQIGFVSYPTKWIELNLLGRIPNLQEIARLLRDKLDSPRYHGREVTLVGHSQGGLVIQAYFARLVNDSEATRLQNIRQAIFLATPCGGSTTAMSLRRLLSIFFHNPQERTLRVLSSEIAEIRERVRERIVAATCDSADRCRIPIHAFCGMQDNIVPEASARGVFDNVKSVPGTHFSILKPKTLRDQRYSEFAEVLLDPGGHAHRFEVESYENIIRVEPCARQTISTTSAKNPRVIAYDNYAKLTRRVRFAASNRCRDRFGFTYDTRRDGYVTGHTSDPNEASASERGRGEDTGTFFRFDFTPETRTTRTTRDTSYWVELEIYNGFRPGERDVHFHPGTYKSRLRLLSYELDLSGYVAAGYHISLTPACYVQPQDVEHGELCKKRNEHQRVEPVLVKPEGIYRWELRDVEHGVVDIVWDVAQAGTETAASTAQPAER